MNWGKWKDLLELIGFVAIIVSLGLVALELRQNTAVTAAQAMLELNSAFDDSYRARAQDPVLAQLIKDGHENPDNLTDLERNQFAAWLRADMNNAEAAWVYYEQGLIAEDTFDGSIAGICSRVITQGVRQYWEDEAKYFAARFRKRIAEWCFQ